MAAACGPETPSSGTGAGDGRQVGGCHREVTFIHQGAVHGGLGPPGQVGRGESGPGVGEGERNKVVAKVGDVEISVERRGVVDRRRTIRIDARRLAETLVGKCGYEPERVLLITDARHALPVRVNRNGLRTVALGTGRISELELPNLPNNADIRQGDLLVTSGLGGQFPPGYPVAEVTSVIREPGQPFATILACARKAIPSMHYMVAAAGSYGIPLADYATFGSSELSEANLAALSSSMACLLANHGQLAVGFDLPGALKLAELVEEQAHCYWGTLSIGGPVLLSTE